MGSQNCSFHRINLLFLKNPQREDERKYDSERAGKRGSEKERKGGGYVSFNLVLGLL